MKQWLIDNIPLIITTLLGSGSFLAYHTEKKKRKIEERQISADALKTMQDAYDRFTANSLQQYDILSKEVESLKKKLIDVTAQLDTEKNNNQKLKASYDRLKQEFDAYKKKYSPKQ